MTERELEIVNRLGLHARAAAKLVRTTSRFDSDVLLIKNGEEVDAKSILGLLLLAAAQGSSVTVRCDGSDEDEALEAVSQLILAGFHEEGSNGGRPSRSEERESGAKPTEPKGERP